jgi:hypothetical protein
MLKTWSALLSSRKFWTGTITVAAVIGAVALRATGKIPADALVPTIVAITATALGVIGGIAWEDGKRNEAGSDVADEAADSSATKEEKKS